MLYRTKKSSTGEFKLPPFPRSVAPLWSSGPCREEDNAASFTWLTRAGFCCCRFELHHTGSTDGGNGKRYNLSRSRRSSAVVDGDAEACAARCLSDEGQVAGTCMAFVVETEIATGSSRCYALHTVGSVTIGDPDANQFLSFRRDS